MRDNLLESRKKKTSLLGTFLEKLKLDHIKYQVGIKIEISEAEFIHYSKLLS